MTSRSSDSLGIRLHMARRDQAGWAKTAATAKARKPRSRWRNTVTTSSYLPNKQQPDQCEAQRCHQPAGVHSGQQPDPDRPGLQVGDKGDHVDDEHRHQQDRGYTPAIALRRERLQVAACHRADMGGDDLDHPEQGGNQKCKPGQLVTSGSAHGGGRTDVGRVVVRSPGDQLGTNAAQQPPIRCRRPIRRLTDGACASRYNSGTRAARPASAMLIGRRDRSTHRHAENVPYRRSHRGLRVDASGGDSASECGMVFFVLLGVCV